MTLPIGVQIKYFVSTVAVGFLIGIFYDIYRLSRQDKFKRNILSSISDFLFWILMSIVAFIFMLKTNNLNLRYYTFLGILFGYMVYSMCISKYLYNVLNILLYVIIKLLRILFRIILYPFRLIFLLLKNLIYSILNFRRKN
ncbi:spore cortex biosynthesis protein YabQ [Caloramator sp. ALD01]|jgi:spore cortex biosynthesis protein YabQ|uniref:Spore cortex biosynthesis protein YabQ n=1 Tax=Caloramator proteoclasticus DSM 10124 TaxID=1121262 RepID=A0A1M4YM56_9CLOT|nr:spore cortex biosynthesis protein YabQ [Caloramator proteoclasticus DSM 10124]